MNQLFDHVSRKVNIFGRSGVGKSSFGRRLILNDQAELKYVFDFEHEFPAKTGFESAFTPEEMLAQIDSGIVVFDPVEMFGGELDEALSFFVRWVMAIQERTLRPAMVYLDELQKFTDVWAISDELKDLFNIGRRRGLDVALIAPASNQLHHVIRGQMTEAVVFHTTEDNSLKWLEKLGFDRGEVETLPPFEFLWKDCQTGEIERGALPAPRFPA